jgi:mannosylfructose-6-phosphate phosphatase
VDDMKLLVTDLDGTLLGDDRSLDGFIAWYEDIRPRLKIVYSSGRFLESIRASIAEYGLPEPDGIICGVGTEIHDLTTGELVPGWPQAAFDWSPQLIREVCAEIAELTEQPAEFLSSYKISYFGRGLDDAILSRLQRRLDDLGQEVSLVYSSNRDLDILPATVDKGTAATFLAQHWEIERGNVIVAGDSGNDLQMFRAGFRGIVVGNAQPELLRVRGANVYHAEGQFAAGVLEGLRHWLAGELAAEDEALATSGQSTPDPSANRGRLE